MFNCQLLPAVLYGAEIFGWTDNAYNKIQLQLNTILRNMIGLSMKSNVGIRNLTSQLGAQRAESCAAGLAVRASLKFPGLKTWIAPLLHTGHEPPPTARTDDNLWLQRAEDWGGWDRLANADSSLRTFIASTRDLARRARLHSTGSYTADIAMERSKSACNRIARAHQKRWADEPDTSAALAHSIKMDYTKNGNLLNVHTGAAPGFGSGINDIIQARCQRYPSAAVCATWRRNPAAVHPKYRNLCPHCDLPTRDTLAHCVLHCSAFQQQRTAYLQPIFDTFDSSSNWHHLPDHDKVGVLLGGSTDGVAIADWCFLAADPTSDKPPHTNAHYSAVRDDLCTPPLPSGWSGCLRVAAFFSSIKSTRREVLCKLRAELAAAPPAADPPGPPASASAASGRLSAHAPMPG